MNFFKRWKQRREIKKYNRAVSNALIEIALGDPSSASKPHVCDDVCNRDENPDCPISYFKRVRPK